MPAGAVPIAPGGGAAGIAHRLPLPRPLPPVLAVGAFLKNTVSGIAGSAALVSDEVGNLDTAAAVRRFEAAAEAMLTLLPGQPIAVAHDLHPDFASTRLADRLADRLGCPTAPVQHHYAHIAAVMAEHLTEEPVLGLALDGFGLGDDGGAWGGELLLADAHGYRRLGHLAPLAQPGGDRAAREPWRMAAAALHALGRGDEIAWRFADRRGAAMLARMLAQDLASPKTTSCGRLFDAACGLLGVKPVAAFEGEAPMALEAMVSEPEADPAGWRIEDGVLDLLPLLDRLPGMPAARGAELFHGTLAAALAAWVAAAAEATGVDRVALAGGCFLNKILSRDLVSRLQPLRLDVLQPRALRPGDTAVSLGQAYATALAGR
jgi:hydrogenase maturation protein HypF